MKVFKIIWRIFFIFLIVLLDLAFIATIANCDINLAYSTNQDGNAIVANVLAQFSFFFINPGKVAMDLVIQATNATVNPDGTYNLVYQVTGPTITPNIPISFLPLIGYFLACNAVFAVIGSAGKKSACIITSIIAIAGLGLYLTAPNVFNNFSTHIVINEGTKIDFSLPVSGGLVACIMIGLILFNFAIVLIPTKGDEAKANSSIKKDDKVKEQN